MNIKEEIKNTGINFNNTFMYDVHTHMHDKAYDTDIDFRMKNLKEKNIKIITIGTDKKENQKAKELAHKYDGVFYTAGLHPHDNIQEELKEEDYIEYMEDIKCVAVGECGLDYFYLKGDKEKGLIENIDREVDRQQGVFIKQIEMAKKYNKSLMIHGRPSVTDEIDNPDGVDAYEDMLFILEKNYKSNPILENKKANGNVHFFVGNADIAQRFINIGFAFSFGGVVTITDEYNEVLKYIPLEYVHAETDSPYVVPRDTEGKRVSKINSSENIEVIINKIAEIKNINIQDLKIKLEKNFVRDFLV